jgi:hypothetical protein
MSHLFTPPKPASPDAALKSTVTELLSQIKSISINTASDIEKHKDSFHRAIARHLLRRRFSKPTTKYDDYIPTFLKVFEESSQRSPVGSVIGAHFILDFLSSYGLNCPIGQLLRWLREVIMNACRLPTRESTVLLSVLFSSLRKLNGVDPVRVVVALVVKILPSLEEMPAGRLSGELIRFILGFEDEINWDVLREVFEAERSDQSDFVWKCLGESGVIELVSDKQARELLGESMFPVCWKYFSRSRKFGELLPWLCAFPADWRLSDSDKEYFDRIFELCASGERVSIFQRYFAQHAHRDCRESPRPCIVGRIGKLVADLSEVLPVSEDAQYDLARRLFALSQTNHDDDDVVTAFIAVIRASLAFVTARPPPVAANSDRMIGDAVVDKGEPPVSFPYHKIERLAFYYMHNPSPAIRLAGLALLNDTAQCFKHQFDDWKDYDLAAQPYAGKFETDVCVYIKKFASEFKSISQILESESAFPCLARAARRMAEARPKFAAKVLNESCAMAATFPRFAIISISTLNSHTASPGTANKVIKQVLQARNLRALQFCPLEYLAALLSKVNATEELEAICAGVTAGERQPGDDHVRAEISRAAWLLASQADRRPIYRAIAHIARHCALLKVIPQPFLTMVGELAPEMSPAEFQVVVLAVLSHSVPDQKPPAFDCLSSHAVEDFLRKVTQVGDDPGLRVLCGDGDPTDALALCEWLSYLPQCHARILRVVQRATVFSECIVAILLRITAAASALEPDGAVAEAWRTVCIRRFPFETLRAVISANPAANVVTFIASLVRNLSSFPLERLPHSRGLLQLLPKSSPTALILDLILLLSEAPDDAQTIVFRRLQPLSGDRESFFIAHLSLLRTAQSAQERFVLLRIFVSFVTSNASLVFPTDARPLSVFGPLLAVLAEFPDNEFCDAVVSLFEIAISSHASRHVLARIALIGCVVAPIQLPRLREEFIAFLGAISEDLATLQIGSALTGLVVYGDAFFLVVRDVVLPAIGSTSLLDDGAKFWAALVKGDPPGAVDTWEICRAIALGGDLVRMKLRTAITQNVFPGKALAQIRAFLLRSSAVSPIVAMQFLEEMERICPALKDAAVAELPGFSCEFGCTREDIRLMFSK